MYIIYNGFLGGYVGKNADCNSGQKLVHLAKDAKRFTKEDAIAYVKTRGESTKGFYRIKKER